MSEMREWLEALPKAELHLHLEGAIPLDALWSLIEKYGGDESVPAREDLRARLTYPDFPSFIETWIWKNGFLREADDFTHIAEAAARSLAEQQIRYAELFFSPSRFAERGLTPQRLAEAIRRGLDRVDGTEVWLIADLVRDHGPVQAARTVAEVAEIRDCGVLGIGLGGSEHRHPAEQFVAAFETARALGLRTTAHAGEAAGADSVRAALEVLRVERIGHATRAEEDPALVERLVERQVPIELCPLSNVATGVVPDIDAHPVRRYQDRGLNLTINTDDPGMFHNSLAEELTLLHERFAFGVDEIRTLVLNALRAAWQSAERRAALEEAFTTDPAWGRTPSVT